MNRALSLLAAAAVTALAPAEASALTLGFAGFYSPGFVTGEAADVKEIAPGGFKGRVSLGVYAGLGLALGFGSNDFVYREAGFTIPDFEPVLSLPMFISTLGADYAFRLGSFRPYLGGGGAIARESAEAFGYEVEDWYGGLYAEGGLRYFPGKSWAVEAGPRYTLLFDEPVIGYDNWELRDFDRSPNHSRLVEFNVGAGYYF
jgi:hypothetical protein